MFDYRKITLCLFFATGLLFAAGESARAGSIMPENKVPGTVESKARRLMQDLKKQGFEVSRGYFKLWTIDDCAYTVARMGLCYGNNPAAPYVVFAVPPWPEEFVDPDSNVWGPSHHGYNDVYRLDPREAIVILGQLPPPGSYFSEQTWVFTRQGTYNTTSTTYYNIAKEVQFLLPLLFAEVPDNPQRIQLFASLSNPNNNVVIESQSGAAFNQVRYFIITPDQLMDKAVRKAFAGISVKDEDVFTEPISSDMNVGLDQSADNFTTLVRYAHPADDTAADAWRNELPLVVLRVRDTRSKRQVLQYPPVVLDPRTAVDEWPLKPDLTSLLWAVSQRWENPCANPDCSDRAKTFLDSQTSPIYEVGPLCTSTIPVSVGENCLGDNWDAAYQLSAFGLMPLDHGEIYAVAGTLGTKTGNATYVGLGINQASILKGVDNRFDEKLDGTANAYAGKVSNTDKFYLYYFTRDCSGLENLTDGNCLAVPETKIPPGDTLGLSIRDYIRPGTQRGPDSSLILPSMMLQLQRP